LDTLIFGVADFAGDLGAKDFKVDRGGLFAHARAQLLIAARAAGLDAIDSVTVEFKDLEQLESDARSAARLGFDGKWAIHPAQLGPIHAAFTPSQEEIDRAQKVVEAYRKADREQGLGAIVLDDEMVDAATLKVEERKLAVARKAGKIR
jgi:citrate lyase subunit beta/citryl-CoA lyase